MLIINLYPKTIQVAAAPGMCVQYVQFNLKAKVSSERRYGRIKRLGVLGSIGIRKL